MPGIKGLEIIIKIADFLIYRTNVTQHFVFQGYTKSLDLSELLNIRNKNLSTSPSELKFNTLNVSYK